MLVTLLKPSAGSASVAGFDVASQPNEVRRRIGVALQDAAIDPLMTGNESLRLQAVMQGLGGRPGQQRAGELLERVGSPKPATGGSAPTPEVCVDVSISLWR